MTLLEQYITELISERLRGGFDIRYFKSLTNPVEMLKYVQDKAQLLRLGKGSGRVVFLLSGSKVLKIARSTMNGRTQNRDEWEGWNRFGGSGTVAQVFDVDKEGFWWIIMEPVRVWQTPQQMLAETGVDDDMVMNLVDRAQEFPAPNNKKGFLKFLTYLKGLEITPGGKQRWSRPNALGIELLYKMFLLTAKYGIEDITRHNQWGKTANGKIVCVDYGITTDQLDD